MLKQQTGCRYRQKTSQFKTDRSGDQRDERALESIAELKTERKTATETKGKRHEQKQEC